VSLLHLLPLSLSDISNVLLDAILVDAAKEKKNAEQPAASAAKETETVDPDKKDCKPVQEDDKVGDLISAEKKVEAKAIHTFKIFSRNQSYVSILQAMSEKTRLQLEVCLRFASLSQFMVLNMCVDCLFVTSVGIILCSTD